MLIRKSCRIIVIREMRTTEKPTQTWMETIRKDIINASHKWDMALNRAKWKKKICVANPKKNGKKAFSLLLFLSQVLISVIHACG